MFKEVDKAFCEHWEARKNLAQTVVQFIGKRFRSSRTGKEYEIKAFKYVGINCDIFIYLKDLNKKWFAISSVSLSDFLGQARLGEFIEIGVENARKDS